MPRTPNVRRNVARSSPIGELPIDAFWRRWIENARQKNDARDAAQQQPPPSTAPTNTQPAAQPSAQPSNTQMTHPETQPTVQPIARSISRPTVQPKTEPPPQPAQRTPAKPTKPAKPPGLPSGKRHLPKNIRFVTIRHRRDWGHHQRFIGPSTRTIVLGPYFTLIDHILDNIVALGPEICHGIERFSFRYMYPRSRFDAARVTDEALINFASACPNLTMLSIPGLSEATGASMLAIGIPASTETTSTRSQNFLTSLMCSEHFVSQALMRKD
ncbi:hypothetical protein B0I35DRAFT_481113 [Stachybotrys elegans]|uniref:Uncharacterized protein n=1 Tax=Stachybotrys elegans TaxID=80388 RepID=A0A8K0WPY4_9HYPO|nr:hypothetical protein B0I35DRAFT_481113 [Stachybotrys elegans]